jgi:hypothetical protein
MKHLMWHPKKFSPQEGLINSSRGFQASYVISFFINIQTPLPTFYKTSNMTLKKFNSGTERCCIGFVVHDECLAPHPPLRTCSAATTHSWPISLSKGTVDRLHHWPAPLYWTRLSFLENSRCTISFRSNGEIWLAGYNFHNLPSQNHTTHGTHIFNLQNWRRITE